MAPGWRHVVLAGVAAAATGAFGVGAPRASGADWSPEQKAVLATLESAIVALRQGSIEKLAPLYDEQFTGWDLTQEKPQRRSEFLADEAAFLKDVKSFDSQVTPLAIELNGNTAVLLVRYTNTVVMGNGTRMVSPGRWSTTLVRRGSGWVFLSSAWIADK
jgi:hypothetical protein